MNCIRPRAPGLAVWLMLAAAGAQADAPEPVVPASAVEAAPAPAPDEDSGRRGAVHGRYGIGYEARHSRGTDTQPGSMARPSGYGRDGRAGRGRRR